MVNLLLLPIGCYLVLTLIVQNSLGILIERDEFDNFCESINRLINQGDGNPIETIKVTSNSDSLRGGKLQQLTNKKETFQFVQQSAGKFNWLATLFQTLLQSQNVAIKLEGTNQTKVGVIGKRQINNLTDYQQSTSSALQLIPCNSIPFPTEIDSNDGQSVKLTLFLINNFLDDYYQRKTIN